MPNPQQNIGTEDNSSDNSSGAGADQDTSADTGVSDQDTSAGDTSAEAGDISAESVSQQTNAATSSSGDSSDSSQTNEQDPNGQDSSAAGQADDQNSQADSTQAASQSDATGVDDNANTQNATGGNGDSESDSADSQNSSQDAGALQAAGQDADSNLNDESPDSPASTCAADQSGAPAPAPGANPQQPPVPGDLQVTVLNNSTGQPIQGAAVSIAGPASFNEASDGAGMVKEHGVPTGTYNVTATNNGFTTETGSTNVPAAGIGTVVIKLTPITVTITLAQPVACPGHPLSITATGTPAGGTFAWTINAPAADLVDGGGASTRSGATVNLLGFQADTATGNIPAQVAAIGVTYTYTNGQTATANQNVTIHAINFVLSSNSISKSPTTVTESAALLTVSFGAAATMSTDPQVQIKLDASCPRKADCASNHQVGWLQTVLTFVSDQRYTHTLIHKTPAMPVRDALPGAPQPFYSAPTKFTGDGDTEAAHHEDSPGTRASWTDPRGASPAPPPPKNKQLRQVTRTESFTAWLVVQNIEWATHDVPGSLAFVGNFDWSMGITVAVDMSQPAGSWATPKTAQPNVPATISPGKGGGAPNLAAPVANDTTNDPSVLHIDPAPEI